MSDLIKGFKEFVAGGSLVPIAVAFVVGTAIAALVKSLVEDMITPIIGLIFGKTDFGALTFKIGKALFHYGSFINAVITFLTVAAAMYFFVVVPYNKFQERRKKEDPIDPTVKKCTECLSEIPADARKCAFCASPQGATAAA